MHSAKHNDNNIWPQARSENSGALALVNSFDTMVIVQLHSGSQKIGKHHEIYLSDIRRAAPEKWKTVVRHAML